MSEEFTKRLNALIAEKNLTDEDVASLCKISPGTVRRWKDGVTAPHPFAHDSVFRILELQETK